MLNYVPASSKSEPPSYNHHVVKEFALDVGFACFASEKLLDILFSMTKAS